MRHEDRSKFKKAIGQIIAAAWDDPGFLDQLVNPDYDATQLKEAVSQKGIDLPSLPGAPEGTALKFVANTEALRHIVIPVKPKFSDIDIGLLALVRQQRIVECCCERSSIELVKDMIEEAAEEQIREEEVGGD